jgi:hypothetical protein
MNSPAGFSPDKPLFLVGSERSGTTMLRLMLNQHSALSWPYEFDFSVDRIPDGEGWPDVDAYADWLSLHRIFLATGLRVDRSLPFPDLLCSFLRQTAEREGVDVIGATCHRHFDKLLRVWPDARFIHILRDPRDVALSCIQMGWAGNVWYAVDRWIEAEESWDRLRARVNQERVLEIRYEQLVAEPEDTLVRICAFVGVPYEPGMLEYASTSTYSKPDPALLYQWKRKASPEQLSLLEFKLGPLLGERGYSPSGVTPRPPASLARLRLQDKLFRTRYRLRVFGLRRIALDFLHRHIGLGGVGRENRLAMNRIEAARLK